MAVDASHIYWADSASGIVYERKLTGGLIIPFNLSNPFTAPAGVAVDSTHVYWANSSDGTIDEARLNTFGPATLISGQASPWGWRWTAATSTGPIPATARSRRPADRRR